MSISGRLKQAEKLVAAKEEVGTEEELFAWLVSNPYVDSQNENLHQWSERMPKRLMRPFIEALKIHATNKSGNPAEWSK